MDGRTQLNDYNVLLDPARKDQYAAKLSGRPAFLYLREIAS